MLIRCPFFKPLNPNKMNNTIQNLKEQFATFRAENPKIRIRDAARTLGVSEAELVSTGENNIRLENGFENLLKEVNQLGYVMALTRNDHAVHERKGVYTKASFNGHIGLVVNPDIDLRLFMNAWHSGFAVVEGDRKSLQFFDQAGEAVHKIYLTENSNLKAYDQLVSSYRDDSSETPLTVPTSKTAFIETPDDQIEVAAFQQAWTELKDTHEFFGLMNRYRVSRKQAMRLAPKGYACEVFWPSVKSLLEEVSEQNMDIMVFVGNRGCIQIHTGKAKKLLQTGSWFNVLDPEFNMHLREDAIESVWRVKKPTSDGIVTSLELFDAEGNVIVQFFGKRKPRVPESVAWRKVVSDYTVQK